MITSNVQTIQSKDLEVQFLGTNIDLNNKVNKKKNNNLDYLIDSTFTNINRFFVLSFKNANDDRMRDYFGKYYMPLAETKDFNALIDNKPFFDQPIKSI